MTPEIIESLQLLSKQILGLEFHLDPKWASTYADHRLNIRRHLYKKTKSKGVLDLANTPKIVFSKADPDTSIYVSISHSPVMGGFVLSPIAIGFDLEQKQRLSPSVLNRISNDDERQMMPENFQEALWTVKESVYKCLDSKPSTMTEVKIQSAEITEDEILKTVSEFNRNKYITLTRIIDSADLCLSISFES